MVANLAFPAGASPADAVLVVERLIEMRLLPDGTRFPSDWVAPRDVFPWWMMFVHAPDRNPEGGQYVHLGHLLVARRHGGFKADGKTERAMHFLACAVPVGTPDQIARMLQDIVMEEREDRPDSDAAVAALRGLAHLDLGSAIGPAQPTRFLASIRALSKDDSKDVLRAALNLVALYGVHDAIGWVSRMIQSADEVVALTAIGTLLWLGAPGREALLRAQGAAQADTQRVLEAVVTALEQNELDRLHPLLTSRHWAMRNAAVRLLHGLVIAGVPANGPLEILINRFKDDDDGDNKFVMGLALSAIIQRMGPAAVEPLLQMATHDHDGSGFLLDAIFRASAPGSSLAQLQAVGDSRRRGPRSAIRGPLACCMGLHPSFPRRLSDWVRHQVVGTLQWSDWRPPQPVAEWFDNPASVDPAELTHLLVSGSERRHDGALASAYVHARPDIIPAWERLLVHQLNEGDEDAWSVLAASLGGAWHPVTTSPADIRCAVGFDAGPPMLPRPEYIGRLLAVASSSLQHSEDAMSLLGTLSTEARLIAAHALSTVPKGIVSIEGAGCAPAARGFGVLGKQVGVLGPNPRLARGPVPLHPHLQPFLAIEPPECRDAGDLMDAVRTSAVVDGSWASSMGPWKDPVALEGLVQSLPLERVQAAAVAARFSESKEMNDLSNRLVQALGPRAMEGDLGALLTPAPNPADAPGSGDPETEAGPGGGHGPDELDLDELLKDLA